MSQIYIPTPQRRQTLLTRLLAAPARALRARWRFILAVRRRYPSIWTDFLRSVLIFVLVTVVGGFIYGEWYNAIYDNDLDLLTRPYVIVQLMILESPEDHPPPEPHLLLFWYMLPPLFAFIVARGAADTFRLFFSREREQEWRKAVASTYRRHVIVMGAGHVGLRVITTLRQLGLDVVAIDLNPDDETEERLRRLHVPLIRGDGTHALTMEEVGITSAVAFIACTGHDPTNQDALRRVNVFKSRHDALRVVVRMWSEQAANELNYRHGIQTALSSARIAAPMFAGLALGFETTPELTINGTQYATLCMRITPNSPLANQRVDVLQSTHHMDVVLLGKGPHDAHVNPSGKLFVQANDTLVVFGQSQQVMRVAASNFLAQWSTKPKPNAAPNSQDASAYRNHVIVMGAGHVGLQVIATLQELGVPVVSIEPRPEAAQRVHNLGVLNIAASGTSSETLEQAGIAHAAAFVACTGNDHINVDAVQQVRASYQSLRVISRLWDEQYAELLTSASKVNKALSSAHIAAPVFVGQALDFDITQILDIFDKKYRTIRFEVDVKSDLIGRRIADLQGTQQYRNGNQRLEVVLHKHNHPESVERVQPPGDVTVQAGDTLVIFAENDLALDFVARNYDPRRYRQAKRRKRPRQQPLAN